MTALGIPLESRIYVAGHKGLVGSAVERKLRSLGYQHLLLRSSKELDLTNSSAVHDFFKKEKPEYVFLCAAKVGGILANKNYPASFIHQNLMIQNHVIHEAMQQGVTRLLFLGSSCIYPRECPQPIKEEYLLTGPLEFTNRPYALAKIAGIEMCWAYNRQYGTRYLCAMPTNLYGPGDNYDLENSHVLPALIRKMHEAKREKTDHVVLWGTGQARREFLYSEDLADAAIHLMNLPNRDYESLFTSETSPPLINIGTGKELTIQALADIIADIVEFKGDIQWDTSKPDGTPRKVLDVSKLSEMGWTYKIPLKEGIKMTYDHVREALDASLCLK
jgi:GDP-L-fucose synthase